MKNSSKHKDCTAKSPQKVYIAGKITGDPDYKAKFAHAQALLEQQGYLVISPAVLPGGLSRGDYAGICFAMIQAADMVALLPDYMTSHGTLLELSTCNYTGKPFLYLAHMDFWKDRE